MRYENSNCMTFCILGHVLPGHMDRRRGPGLPTFGVPVGPWTAGFLTPLNVSDLLTADVTGIQWLSLDRQDWVAHAAWCPPGCTRRALR